MRKLTALAALLVAVALPSAASAQIFLGARLGYAVPWGDAMKDWAVDESIKSQIPVTIDLGLKLGKALSFGAYAAYGFAQPSEGRQDDCDVSNSTCSAASLRVGAQVSLHAANTGATELWGGVGFGYEELRTEDSKGLIPELTFKGYDATLQGGLDFLVSPSLRIGPFVSATVGRFSKTETTAEVDIANKELHGWLQAGLRGFFTL
jgi:hypothetical protein